jgi:hypothetical protein
VVKDIEPYQKHMVKPQGQYIRVFQGKAAGQIEHRCGGGRKQEVQKSIGLAGFNRASQHIFYYDDNGKQQSRHVELINIAHIFIL